MWETPDWCPSITYMSRNHISGIYARSPRLVPQHHCYVAQPHFSILFFFFAKLHYHLLCGSQLYSPVCSSPVNSCFMSLNHPFWLLAGTAQPRFSRNLTSICCATSLFHTLFLFFFFEKYHYHLLTGSQLYLSCVHQTCEKLFCESKLPILALGKYCATST